MIMYTNAAPFNVLVTGPTAVTALAAPAAKATK